MILAPRLRAEPTDTRGKTVIQLGHERIELDLSEKILKLGLDLHYRQVTVAMQEDGRLVRPGGKMAYPDFLKMDQKEAGARLADLQLLRSRRQRVLVRSQAERTTGRLASQSAALRGGAKPVAQTNRSLGCRVLLT
jgi:hypothetical protein